MRTPHVLLTTAEVEAAAADLMRHPMFVFDVETNGLNPQTNDLLWIGLGGPSSVYLIPTGHPKGVTLAPEHKEKKAAFLLYPEDDPRGKTKLGKPSLRQVEYNVPATFAPPPKQLYPHEVMEALRPLMFSDRGKAGHNVKFDLQTVAKYYDGEIPPGPYHDTILVQHTLVEDLDAYDLKSLTCDWFGIPFAKRKTFYPNLGKSGIEKYGMDEVARYLAKDLRYCWLRFQRFHPLLVRKGLSPIYDFEMEVYPIIMRMEQQGFPVDLSRMETVRRDLEAQITEVEARCYEIAGDEFNLSDLDAKRWVMFGEARLSGDGKPIPEYGKSKRQLHTLRLPVLSRTKGSRTPSMTQAVLEFYSDRGSHLADLFLEWSGLEKLRGTFIGHPPDPTAKKQEDQEPTGLYRFTVPHNGSPPTVHTGYMQHGTVTGRLSASKPNLQQLPREMEGRASIRDLFIAPPGQQLIVADYDQVELRCAGYLSKDANMIKVFKEGQDIHRQAAAAMFDCSLEEVTSDMRAVGKTQNFAVLYGAGPGKIAGVAGCSMERAEELIDGYFQAFPALEKWKARELQNARKRGDRANAVQPPHVLIPPNGRMRRLPDLFVLDHETDAYGKSIRWRRYRAERQAINAIVQGFASNITKLAMLDLDIVLPPGAVMLAQVHDEIVFQAQEEVAEDVMKIVVGTMGSVADPKSGKSILGEIPLVASAATGNSWADAKRKAA